MRSAGRMATSRLARAGVALVLVAGCSPQPTAAPPSDVLPTRTEGLATKGPSPSAAAGLGIAWETFPRLQDMGLVVHGPAGWLVLRDCGESLCPVVSGWHSEDLEAWEAIELPRSGDVTQLYAAASNAGYIVSATDYDDVGRYGEGFLQVWRSSDARAWERVGERPLGACNIAGCPVALPVGLAPNGRMYGGAASPRDGPEGPAHVSDDGVHWQDATIPRSWMGVGVDEIVGRYSVSTPAELFVPGLACNGQGAQRLCAGHLWSTTDAGTWVEEQSFPLPGGDGVLIDADGVQRVAAVVNCVSGSFPEECTTDLWTGAMGREWTAVATALDVTASGLQATGDDFVLVGERDGRFVSYISPDGASWTEVSSDTLGAMGECGRGSLAGGAGNLLFTTRCGAWRGTVQPAS